MTWNDFVMGRNDPEPCGSIWAKYFKSLQSACFFTTKIRYLKLDDLKVLKRLPDLLYNVKIGQGHLETCFVLLYVGVAAILVK